MDDLVSTVSLRNGIGHTHTVELFKKTQYDGCNQQVVVENGIWVIQRRNKTLETFLVIMIGCVWIKAADLAKMPGRQCKNCLVESAT